MGGLGMNRSRVSATGRLCFKLWMPPELAALRELNPDLLHVRLFWAQAEGAAATLGKLFFW